MNNRQSSLRTWILGDKKFYRMVLTILIPIVIQNTVTSFVNLLDNLMIGQVGTDQMSGVAIVNQLMMVFNICVFGALSAPGIFSAQFYGKGDHDGVRHTFRFKILIIIVLLSVALAVLGFFGSQLIQLYLTDGSAAARQAQKYAEAYLRVMLLGLLPFALTNAYSGTLRSMGETMIPMAAGIAATVTNLVGNYILIFGRFGAPQLGVVGAAVATVISRFVELAIVMVFAHRNTERFRFLQGAYRTLKIPGELAKTMLVKGAPLMANEVLFSVGLATLTQCYSVRGYMVIASQNISNTIWNVFTVVVFAFGEAVSIIIGQKLGAGELDEARHSAWKLAAFNFACCVVVGGALASLAGVIPHLYNTEVEIRNLASQFIRILGFCMPLVGFCNCAYFTLRSGGKMFITFLFDSCYLWAVSILLAFTLTRFTDLPILTIYLIIQLADFLKCVLGFVLMKRGKWVNNMVADF